MSWIKGIPEEDGIYWFDSGFKHSDKPSVLKITRHYKYVFGDYGSMPLSSVFTESRADKVSHMLVPKTEDWVDLSSIKEPCRAWIKHACGHLGLALLGPSWSTTIVWKYHPTEGDTSGIHIRADEGYKFSVVEIPEIK